MTTDFEHNMSYWDRLDELEREIVFESNANQENFMRWAKGLEIVFGSHPSVQVRLAVTSLYRMLRKRFPEFVDWELRQNPTTVEEQSATIN